MEKIKFLFKFELLGHSMEIEIEAYCKEHAELIFMNKIECLIHINKIITLQEN